jgi:hypothetical protein
VVKGFLIPSTQLKNDLIWRERDRANKFAQRDQEGFASQLFWRDALKFEVPNLFIVAPSLFTAYPEKTPR